MKQTSFKFLFTHLFGEGEEEGGNKLKQTGKRNIKGKRSPLSCTV